MSNLLEDINLEILLNGDHETVSLRDSLLNIPITDMLSDLEWNKLNTKTKQKTLFWYSLSWIMYYIVLLPTYNEKNSMYIVSSTIIKKFPSLCNMKNVCYICLLL